MHRIFAGKLLPYRMRILIDEKSRVGQGTINIHEGLTSWHLLSSVEYFMCKTTTATPPINPAVKLGAQRGFGR
jgi:hypothetical protein